MGLMSRGWGAGTGKECFLFNPALNHWSRGQWRPLQPPRARFHLASPALFCQPLEEAPPRCAPHKIRFTSVIEMKQPVHGAWRLPGPASATSTGPSFTVFVTLGTHNSIQALFSCPGPFIVKNFRRECSLVEPFSL